jgi:hypothetical protein
MRKPFTLLSWGALLVLVAPAVPALACGSSPKPPEGPALPASAAAPSADAASPADTAAASDAGATSAAPSADAGGGSPAEKCDALVNDAQLALDDWRIKADDKCKKDSDCVVIKGRACGFNCTNGAIAKASEASWNETVAKVKDGQCKKWSEADCAKVKAKPAPQCQDKKAACVAGKCTAK